MAAIVEAAIGRALVNLDEAALGGARKGRRRSKIAHPRRIDDGGRVEFVKRGSARFLHTGRQIFEPCLVGSNLARLCRARLAAELLADEAATGNGRSCVQVHGGMGFMRGSVIERMSRDARVQSIGGGATEVMLEEIAKRMGA